ncbi:MAG: MBOAT family protein [Ruminococcus sp.]|nr:MBOAT family protein [Ruminococcus sp.]
MVFSSLFFIYIFLLLCLISYWAVGSLKYKNFILILFSLIFYAWGEPVWVSLLIFSAFQNYLSGRLIEKFRGKAGAKAVMILSLVLNLGLLFGFKYTGFFVENINLIAGTSIPVPDIRLPIGISFFTFQAISYTVDCYWERVNVQKSFWKLLLYLSMFPQLVAGPIVRYSTIEQEIDERSVTVEDISYGISRLIVGLGKKVILANNLSVIVDSFFGGELGGVSVLGTWYAVIVYAMQIYFDFSGYSDMAIGMGRMFGFHFDENFRHPFLCKDVTEFWQRWHISLGSFFRDYLLYIPLFGKRRPYASLFLVWFSTGLWHGASWNFIIWGLYFGIFIFLERQLGKKRMKKIPIGIRHFYNKIVIILGFGIFYFESLPRLGGFFRNLVGANGNMLVDEVTKLSVMNNLFLLLAALVCCFPIGELFGKLAKKSEASQIAVGAGQILFNIAVFLTSSILLVDATNNPFLYFRF